MLSLEIFSRNRAKLRSLKSSLMFMGFKSKSSKIYKKISHMLRNCSFTSQKTKNIGRKRPFKKLSTRSSISLTASETTPKNNLLSLSSEKSPTKNHEISLCASLHFPTSSILYRSLKIN